MPKPVSPTPKSSAANSTVCVKRVLTKAADIDAAASFTSAGEPVVLSLRRQDLNDVPRAGTGSWSVHALRQPERSGGEHADTSLAIVQELGERLGLTNLRILKGIFPEDTGGQVADRRFRRFHVGA